ncbi:Uncharacterised protein [Streptococcus pneumoniae]|nr:Uncharacterised protein [Streptococcus pneumoniae]CIW06515.1 Uncharacterised protein [Streptococcus pneumoniae]
MHSLSRVIAVLLELSPLQAYSIVKFSPKEDDLIHDDAILVQFGILEVHDSPYELLLLYHTHSYRFSCSIYLS